MPESTLKTRSRIGVAVKKGDPQAIAEAKRDHAAAKVAAAIEHAFTETLPPTDAQRGELAQMILGGGDAA